ncbi:MAG: helix-turn-helix domain-containing protein [Pseudomonadota bacterium]
MQNPRSPAQTPLRTDVLLFPHFSNLCLANAVEPLRAANMLSGRPLYRWRHLTLDARTVASSSGLPVVPDGTLTGEAGDLLLVMPSYGVERLLTPTTLRTLRAAARRYGLVAGLDAGSWLMAAAGLLDGRRATIHWDMLDAFAERFPEVEVQTERVVFDGPDRASCGGATTTLELMLHWIEQDHGTMLRLDVAALFMHGEKAPSTSPAQTYGRRLDAVAALMRRNIEVPLPIGEIAQRLGLTQRRLEDVVRKQAGRPPAALYRSIRLREARRMVETSTLRIAEIAPRCGYADPAALTRAFRREFGTAPSALRV